MKFNKWTLGLAAIGVVSMASAVRADESKPSALQTALSNTTISGYVSASANVGLTDNYNNSPAAKIPFQAGKENGFNLDVVKLSIAKPEDATPWASGYEVDLLFGPDAVGYNTSANAATKVSTTVGGTTYTATGGTLADFGIKQAFVTLNAPIGNGLDFKIGVFDSPLGYEVFDSGSNPNYTRSYGYAVEPTELTGIQATYKVCDALTLNGGVADTSVAGINDRATEPGQAQDSTAWHDAYFGDVSLTAPASWGSMAGSTAFAGVLYGNVNGGNYMGGDQINYYAGLTLNTPLKQLTVGAAFDYVQNVGGGTAANHLSGPLPIHSVDTSDVDNEWVAGLYTTYKATDKLSFDARAEYVENDDSFNTSQGQGITPSQNLVELTGTVEYDLWANVETRAEIRWDQDLSESEGVVAGSVGTGRDSVGLYANVIYKF